MKGPVSIKKCENDSSGGESGRATGSRYRFRYVLLGRERATVDCINFFTAAAVSCVRPKVRFLPKKDDYRVDSGHIRHTKLFRP